MSLAPKAMPAWVKPLVDKVDQHAEKIESHALEIDNLKSVYKDISEATTIVKKIWKAIKWGAPTVIGSAVTAGYINGDFAKILSAIFS